MRIVVGCQTLLTFAPIGIGCSRNRVRRLDHVIHTQKFYSLAAGRHRQINHFQAMVDQR